MDRFELIKKHIGLVLGGIGEVEAFGTVIREIMEKLELQTFLITSDPYELKKYRCDQEILDDQDEKRWILTVDKSLVVLVGTEFLAETYVLRKGLIGITDAPVLVESNLDVKSWVAQVNLEKWFDELTKEKQKNILDL